MRWQGVRGHRERSMLMAFTAGSCAFYTGKPNPYPKIAESELHAEWQKGFEYRANLKSETPDQ